ncbi:MAG: bifunctional DNA primase/polymerase [Candidatus Methanomethylicaceae archaeon]
MDNKIVIELSKYFKLNFHVIRLKDNSKEPVNKWREPQNWIQDPSDVNGGNIGIICDQIIVFDADTLETIEFLEQIQEFRETTRVRTRKGKHYYFLRSGDFLVKTEKIYKDKIKIDVKADGGYVVAPPSQIDGVEYVFETDLENIRMLTLEEYQNLLGRIKEKLGLLKKEGGSAPNHRKGEIDLGKLKEVLKRHYREGVRQDIVLYTSAILRKKGVDQETVKNFIAELCHETLDFDIRQRLSGVEATYKKAVSELKGISGLLELGISREELRCISGKEDNFSTTTGTELGVGFLTDDTYVYAVKNKGGKTERFLIGPRIKVASKIYSGVDVMFEIEFEGRRKIMREIKDIEAIRKLTGIEVFQEKAYLQWLVEETRNGVPERYNRTQTGWEDDIFIYPTFQPNDVWENWFWYRKIKQYKSNIGLHHKLVIEALRDGKYLAVVYAFCLASILNNPLETNPGVLFITGPARAGKTTVAKLGVNLFLPSHNVFVTSHTTSVGFELLMKSLKDLPILFDECVLKNLDLEKIVFMVASRVGKVRGTKDLSINISDIASNIIFTSEALEQSTFKRAGAQRRLCSLTLDDFQRSAFSALRIEDIHKFNKCWGAGLDIIEFIVKNKEKVVNLKETEEKAIERNSLHSLYHVALPMLTAIRVFEEFYHEEFPVTYNTCLALLNEQKEEFEKKTDLVERFRDEFAQFLVQKANQIIDLQNTDKKTYGDIIGQKEGEDFFILTKAFADFCYELGLEMKLLIRELVNSNILIPGSGRGFRKMKKIAGTTVSTYHIKLT